MATITASGSPAFSNSLTVPADGPAAHASDVVNPMQKLLDNDAEIRAQKAAASGIATLDGSGKVVQRAPGALVLADAVENNDIGHNVVNGWEDVAGSTLTFTAVAGDNVFVDATALIQATGSGLANARIVIHDSASGGTDYTTTMGTSPNVTATSSVVRLLSFKKGLAVGTVTVRLQLQNANPGVNDARITYFQVHTQQTRP